MSTQSSHLHAKGHHEVPIHYAAGTQNVQELPGHGDKPSSTSSLSLLGTSRKSQPDPQSTVSATESSRSSVTVSSVSQRPSNMQNLRNWCSSRRQRRGISARNRDWQQNYTGEYDIDAWARGARYDQYGQPLPGTTRRRRRRRHRTGGAGQANGGQRRTTRRSTANRAYWNGNARQTLNDGLRYATQAGIFDDSSNASTAGLGRSYRRTGDLPRVAPPGPPTMAMTDGFDDVASMAYMGGIPNRAGAPTATQANSWDDAYDNDPLMDRFWRSGAALDNPPPGDYEPNPFGTPGAAVYGGTGTRAMPRREFVDPQDGYVQWAEDSEYEPSFYGGGPSGGFNPYGPYGAYEFY